MGLMLEEVLWLCGAALAVFAVMMLLHVRPHRGTMAGI